MNLENGYNVFNENECLEMFESICFYPVTRIAPLKRNPENGYNVFDENEI